MSGISRIRMHLTSSLEEMVRKVFPSLAKISLKGLTTEIFFLVKGVDKNMGSHVFLN